MLVLREVVFLDNPGKPLSSLLFKGKLRVLLGFFLEIFSMIFFLVSFGFGALILDFGRPFWGLCSFFFQATLSLFCFCF